MEYSNDPAAGQLVEELWSLQAARRNTALRRLQAPGPDEASLQRICEAAGHAPDHGSLRPWRFIVIPWHKRDELGQAFVEVLEQRDPDCDEPARKAAYDKGFHAPCLLVAVVRDDPAAPRVPLEERLISLGCAIQNMLTAAQALGFASGLASGASLEADGMRRLLRLEAGERAVCFIGFGSAQAPKPPRPRPQTAQYVTLL